MFIESEAAFELGGYATQGANGTLAHEKSF